MNRRIFSPHPHISQRLENLLVKSSYSSNEIQKNILVLSDHYQVSKEHSLIWNQEIFKQSYLFYFGILNHIRLLSILNQCLPFFKEKIEFCYDFGSGLGVGLETLFLFSSPRQEESSKMSIQKSFSFPFSKETNFVSLDVSNDALEFQKKWLKPYGMNILFQQSSLNEKLPIKIEKKGSLALFSYVLNELSHPNLDLFETDHILIVEPATQIASRKLLRLRQNLISKGYQILAPCTHQGTCPILLHSKTNWCFDRVEVEFPFWYQQLFKKFPIQNDWLSFSYLFASRTLSNSNQGRWRVIGSPLKEKGKIKQMVCHSEEKQFFSWLNKKNNYEWIPQGACLETPRDFTLKGDEVRIHGKINEGLL